MIGAPFGRTATEVMIWLGEESKDVGGKLEDLSFTLLEQSNECLLAAQPLA